MLDPKTRTLQWYIVLDDVDDDIELRDSYSIIACLEKRRSELCCIQLLQQRKAKGGKQRKTNTIPPIQLQNVAHFVQHLNRLTQYDLNSSTFWNAFIASVLLFVHVRGKKRSALALALALALAVVFAIVPGHFLGAHSQCVSHHESDSFHYLLFYRFPMVEKNSFEQCTLNIEEYSCVLLRSPSEEASQYTTN
jgi:hypothetical protein